MRRLLFVLLLALAAPQAADAQSPPYRAAVARLAVDDATPFEALVVYPALADETPLEIGPFALHAARDAPVARPVEWERFPIVLFSHGNGRGAGTPLPHRLLLLHLAREGFIVIARSIRERQGRSSRGRASFAGRWRQCLPMPASRRVPTPGGWR